MQHINFGSLLTQIDVEPAAVVRAVARGRGEGQVVALPRFADRPDVAECAGQINQSSPSHFILTPLLEAAVRRSSDSATEAYALGAAIEDP